MADAFTRDKLEWLEQIASDSTLPPTAARLAIILCSFVNRGTGDAFPSIPTLARRLGVVENAVRKSLKAMVEGDHLEIEAGGGRNATNRYRWTLKPSTEMQGIETAEPCTSLKGNGSRPLTLVKGKEEKPCTGVHPLDTETLHGRSLNPARAFTKPCTPVHPNLMKNTIEEPFEEKYTPSPTPDRKAKPENNPPSVRQILESCLSPQTAADVIAHRKAKRSPLTSRAAHLLVDAFNEYGAPEAAAAEMIARGWTGFKAEWMRNSVGFAHRQAHGNKHISRAFQDLDRD